MDLRIPVTFYPIVLPAPIAWLLFLTAVGGGVGFGLVRGLKRGVGAGLGAWVLGTVGLLLTTMIRSMVITFFVPEG